MYECDYCQLLSDDKNYLEIHENKIHKYKCDYCNLYLDTIKLIKEHIYTIHVIKELE